MPETNNEKDFLWKESSVEETREPSESHIWMDKTETDTKESLPVVENTELYLETKIILNRLKSLHLNKLEVAELLDQETKSFTDKDFSALTYVALKKFQRETPNTEQYLDQIHNFIFEITAKSPASNNLIEFKASLERILNKYNG